MRVVDRRGCGIGKMEQEQAASCTANFQIRGTDSIVTTLEYKTSHFLIAKAILDIVISTYNLAISQTTHRAHP